MSKFKMQWNFAAQKLMIKYIQHGIFFQKGFRCHAIFFPKIKCFLLKNCKLIQCSIFLLWCAIKQEMFPNSLPGKKKVGPSFSLCSNRQQELVSMLKYTLIEQN